MPTLRPLAPILALLALGACGGPYPKLVPTAELLAAPPATPAPVEDLSARAAALQAQADTLRATPVIEADTMPVPATPPAAE